MNNIILSKSNQKNTKPSGFALISALFILIVLTTIASFTVNIAGITRNTTNFSLLGIKAYFAASSGIEWGRYQVSQNPTTCPAATTLTLTQAGLENFEVQITCLATAFTEGNNNLTIFTLTAVARQGVLGTPHYISRELQTSIAMSY